jgi:hypothetical protein
MKIAAIDLKNALHEFGKVCGLQGLKEKVEMIWHEAIMEDQDAVFIKIHPKDMKHPHIIIMGLEYGSSVVPPRHYMV